MGKFTAEEIQIAKAVDLVDLAEQIGIPLKRKGRFYQAVGMDSVMIFNRSSWCRFSQGVGGSTIDFLEYFRNMDFVEAVKYLLEFAGYIRTETMQKFQPERQTEKIEETKQRKDIPKDPFVLPSKSETSRRLYGYLIKQRKLSKQMIDFSHTCWKERNCGRRSSLQGVCAKGVDSRMEELLSHQTQEAGRFANRTGVLLAEIEVGSGKTDSRCLELLSVFPYMERRSAISICVVLSILSGVLGGAP